MLSLILALALSEPATATTPPTAPPPQPVEKVRYSKADQVTCKWVSTAGGIARHVCMTSRDWRNDQIERQRHVDDFQRRALTVMPH
jgi:hypothetical protein